jgi:hypothetical protein
VCEDSQVVVGDICRDKKEVECESKGMTKYVNPNNSSDVTCAKINPAPYINQWMDANGNLKQPSDGWMHCSAASIVMGLSGIGRVKSNDYGTLKSMINNDSALSENMNGIFFTNGKQCVNLQGVFSYTAQGPYSYEYPQGSGKMIYVAACNHGHWWNMEAFLKNNVGVNVLASGNRGKSTTESFIESVKSSIDVGGYVLQGAGLYNQPGYENYPVEHIFLITGYTDDNRVIVNDSFANIQIDNNGDGWPDRSGNYIAYSFSGNGAIYEFNGRNWGFWSFINFK